MATTFLTDDSLRSLAPSVFAEHAHASRSDRYAYIPTARVVTALRDEGFAPVKVQTARVRTEGRAGFEKHMIRFRREDAVPTVGGILPEVVLVNSHDGSTSYSLSAGLFRLICSNGLVVPHGDGMSASVKVRHSGSQIVDDVIDATYRVLSDSTTAIETAETWGKINLTDGEQLALATAAHQVRFADAHGEVDTPIRADQLLAPRRYDDRKSDLWTTFNRVQENAVKGGLRGRGVDSNGRIRRTTTKEVRGIDGNLNLNKALWILADALAKAKT